MREVGGITSVRWGECDKREGYYRGFGNGERERERRCENGRGHDSKHDMTTSMIMTRYYMIITRRNTNM